MLSVGAAVVAAACSGSDGSSPILAKAESQVLTVDDATELMLGAPQLNIQAEVVDALANLWVDYALLAHAANVDPSFERIDLSDVVEREAERMQIVAMVDALVSPDTTISEAELRDVFSEEAFGVEVRARHILLTLPRGFSDSERDSVRNTLSEIRDEIAEGKSFESAAGEYSEDPGTASLGGDLGFFARGQMVSTFDEAAFGLDVGDVSDPIETAFGFHLIKVEERREPSFDSLSSAIRDLVIQRRAVAAESLFIQQLEGGIEFDFAEDAVELTRQLAGNPELELSSRAARRPLLEAGSSSVTLGEVKLLMQTQPTGWRADLLGADDRSIREGVLRQLAQRELLLDRARREGFEVSQIDRDSLEGDARATFREAAGGLGLLTLEPLPGESASDAVGRIALERVREALTGARDPAGLVALGFVLRSQYEGEVLLPGIQLTVAASRERRESPTIPDATEPAVIEPASTPPDSSGESQ